MFLGAKSSTIHRVFTRSGKPLTISSFPFFLLCLLFFFLFLFLLFFSYISVSTTPHRSHFGSRAISARTGVTAVSDRATRACRASLFKMAQVSHGNHGRALVIGSRAVSALFTKFDLVMGLFSFLVVLASLLVWGRSAAVGALVYEIRCA